MGPHSVWLMELLAGRFELRPDMRILDMGCGSAATSIFVAMEHEAEVWAADLWVSPHDNGRRVMEAGVFGRVYPIHAEARAYPSQRGFFDAALSVDSYRYWGSEPGYVDYLASFVKPGGLLGIIVPGVTTDGPVPSPRSTAGRGGRNCGSRAPSSRRPRAAQSTDGSCGIGSSRPAQCPTARPLPTSPMHRCYSTTPAVTWVWLTSSPKPQLRRRADHHADNVERPLRALPAGSGASIRESIIGGNLCRVANHTIWSTAA